MAENNRNIRKEIDTKLNDPVLRGALARFAEQYPVARLKAYENVEDVDGLRNSFKAMKVDVVEHLEEIADKFEESVKARGAHFFRAKDGAALKEYLNKVCKENNVKRIIKSKSMATEEIHLNEYLKEEGYHVMETDMGEWIISIAGHKPSHMVMPAIHLSKEQCAEYFSKELGRKIEPVIYDMIQTARKNLRSEFIEADMGITGANFGIAENGAIGLVTNEGNARLATTMPRVHVIVIGYEKLIRNTQDAAKILRLLPRNGTGQRMTSYMTMVDGATPIIHKKDGQWVEEDRVCHVILLDNGRLEAAKDPVLKEVYHCVRCASCLNVCPVYTLVGGHVYGHIYAGGVGAILTALLHSMGDFEKINELCIGCRKCVEICPGKMAIPDLIDELRARNVKQKGLPFMVSAVFENVLSSRKVFHTLLRAASLAQKPFTSGKMIRHLPLFFAGLSKDRSLPAVAETPLRDRMANLVKKNKPNAKKRIAFFSGCNTDFVFPDTGENAIKVLQDLGYEVVFPEDQSCCGKPIIGMGDRETAKNVALRNIEAFEEAKPDYIISTCPTCTETWHKTYVELFADDPKWKDRVEKIAHKVREFTSFVAADYEKLGRLNPTKGNEKVTYHDSCHMRRGLGVHEQPRKLLEAAPGYEFVEMHNCDKCCGMAGAFGVKYVELSMPILKDKIKNIQESGATTVAVACPACMMQIGGGLDKQAQGIKVKHVADILAENLK